MIRFRFESVELRQRLRETEFWPLAFRTENSLASQIHNPTRAVWKKVEDDDGMQGAGDRLEDDEQYIRYSNAARWR